MLRLIAYHKIYVLIIALYTFNRLEHGTGRYGLFAYHTNLRYASKRLSDRLLFRLRQCLYGYMRIHPIRLR